MNKTDPPTVAPPIAHTTELQKIAQRVKAILGQGRQSWQQNRSQERADDHGLPGVRQSDQRVVSLVLAVVSQEDQALVARASHGVVEVLGLRLGTGHLTVSRHQL